MPTNQPLKILFLSAEVVPFARTGGLADVAGSLPKAIHDLGHDIRVCMPRYGRIQIEKFGLRKVLSPFPVPMDTQSDQASLYEAEMAPGLPVYFVDNPRLYDRDGIYMYPDDAERWIFWCRAALEACKRLNWQPDIVHCNDWHTGFVPNWLVTIYQKDTLLAQTASLYTIHTLAYQGIFGYRVLEIAGIDEYGFIVHPEMHDFNDAVDFMARGILFADVITTVSERYAQEILTPEFGERHDPILRDRRDRLFGVLNGIDTNEYNPATDPYISANFDIEHLEARPANKLALQREAGLTPDPEAPLLGVISRMNDQKGYDLLSQVLDPLIANTNAQFVILGTGEERYHRLLSDLHNRYLQRVGVFLTFNMLLARQIYAGSDIFLMPSRFEPCGLGQMIAMRYGSVPVVRLIGGLADTVQDYDPRTGEGHGFTFTRYDSMALYAALIRALETYRNPPLWRTLQTRGMRLDFSWSRSASRYVELYRIAQAFKRASVI